MLSYSLRLPVAFKKGKESLPSAVLRPLPWKKAAKWSLAILMFVVVFFAGLLLGQDAAFRTSLYVNSANEMVAEKLAQEGNTRFAARRAARLYDALVSDFVRYRDSPKLKDKLVAGLNKMEIGGVMDTEKGAVMVRKAAEHRLAYFQVANLAERAEWNRLTAKPEFWQWASEYERQASDYSNLLGRVVTADQLLLSVDVQELLSDEQAMAQAKSRSGK